LPQNANGFNKSFKGEQMILTVTMNPAIDKVYMVNHYALGEVHRPDKTIASPGGKGLNVARVAKQLGEDVGVTGPIGGGNGSFIKTKIEELGIIPRFVDVKGETRIRIETISINS